MDLIFLEPRVNGNEVSEKVERIEGAVNTVLDEKFPYLSLDGKYLYFSSTGHESQGGYDIFRSRKASLGFVSTKSLGNTINSPEDELAFIPATATISYMTSNRAGGEGSYDIYRVKETVLNLFVSGQILNSRTNEPLANAAVILLDDAGEEAASLKSDENGHYSFSVESYADYTILSYKDGFIRNKVSLNTISDVDKTFLEDITLEPEVAEIIVTEDKKTLKIDNILFDYDSAKIKDESHTALNRVVTTLEANPSMKIAINAHTDSQGSAGYNLKLSGKRATSARKYLISKGISLERIISNGFGEMKPLVDCKENCTEDDFKVNRRVEFEVIED